ncbi:OadG family protein [Rheinheimera sp. YQF-2]|jgi:oxaloacetate decarboxylase gamma subunit|uniref:Probable oxaloacetate decarboxylase gamma chain n=1 Tax=Rheinheimera lutimaris TaxID=2740584 RepID=A0A7Y5EM37_9GAMM|nr:OadG family transporter subunit [Rheinheimera lutimaris]NRQ43828.1 OadG family protein [Rheinheimera lutimaris]
MVAELMLEAANLMLIGMAAVFAFLLLLVLLVQLLSSVMQRYFPVKPVEKPAISDTTAKGLNPAVVAAITTAVHQYRQQQ